MRAPDTLKPLRPIQAANATEAPFVMVHSRGLVRKRSRSAKLRLA
jgi:hypothetical protein